MIEQISTFKPHPSDPGRYAGHCSQFRAQLPRGRTFFAYADNISSM